MVLEISVQSKVALHDGSLWLNQFLTSSGEEARKHKQPGQTSKAFLPFLKAYPQLANFLVQCPIT